MADKPWNIALYAYDAHEQASQGRVLLFGRVKTQFHATELKTCCVVVESIQRCVLFEPRTTGTGTGASTRTSTSHDWSALQQEVTQVLENHHIPAFDMQRVQRYPYCFDTRSSGYGGGRGAVDRGNGEKQDFLQVSYPFRFDALPADLQGHTFARVYGTQSSALEVLCLERGIKGPCWMAIRQARRVENRMSRVAVCSEEYTCTMDMLLVAPGATSPPPPMLSAVVLAMTYRQDGKRQQPRVTQVALLYVPAMAVDRPTEVTDAQCFMFARSDDDDKVGVVEAVFAQLHKLDPDMLIGHELHTRQLPLLLETARATKCQTWPNLGRVRASSSSTWVLPKSTTRRFGVSQAIGRLRVDTCLAAQDMLVHERSYALSDLVPTPTSMDMSISMSTGGDNGKAALERDAKATLTLLQKLGVLPLTLQLTQICGNLWNRALEAKPRANAVEWLLLHEFHSAGYIVAEKKPYGQPREGDTYQGGLVLEPKTGFYPTYVLLFDYNSLYPSIIQEYQLCFSRVLRSGDDDDDQKRSGVAAPRAPQAPQAPLPHLMADLVERRRTVRAQLLTTPPEETTLRWQLDIKQRALKLVANSMYGCLGSPTGRFYMQSLAAEITARGRQVLQRTVQLACDELHHQIIYGDTDSMMVLTQETEYERAKAVGEQLKSDLQRLLKFRVLHMDIDHVYSQVLLLKKKRYAALEAPDGRLEMKGLDLVRRDWSSLSSRLGKQVLQHLFANAPNDVLRVLREVRHDMDHDKIALDEYALFKRLSRPPSEYKDAKREPHVQVALQLQARGQPVPVGHFIPYIVCHGDNPNKALRCFHPSILEEVRQRTTEWLGGVSAAAQLPNRLRVDKAYYLEEQVFKPVARLCAGIGHKDLRAEEIAKALGLDIKHLRWTEIGATEEQEEEEEEEEDGDEDNWLAAQWKAERRLPPIVPGLGISCLYCKQTRTISGAFEQRVPAQEIVDAVAKTAVKKDEKPPAVLISSLILTETKSKGKRKRKREDDGKEEKEDKSHTRVRHISPAIKKEAGAAGAATVTVSSLKCPTPECHGLVLDGEDEERVKKALVLALSEALRKLRPEPYRCALRQCAVQAERGGQRCTCGFWMISGFSRARWLRTLREWTLAFDTQEREAQRVPCVLPETHQRILAELYECARSYCAAALSR